MKLVFDGKTSDEIKEYLLSQNGIIKVDLKVKDYNSYFDIKFNSSITPIIIYKHIDIFKENKYSTLKAFDKENISEYKTLKYVAKDLCCEYCYMNFVEKMFENDNIKSVKSNYDFIRHNNVEIIIEYNKEIDESNIIKFIKDNL